ncbi:MAG: hypothetical protein JWQ16_551 [Novosphingobium sp.]|nr:hypothetical protein [Novosphingobium sp.]
MTLGAKAASGSDAARDWEAVRAASDIQFAPVAPPVPPKTPDWLLSFAHWLEHLLGPLGKHLGMSWPVIEKILIGLAVIGVLVLLWAVLSPLIGRLRDRHPAAEPEWTPDHAEAVALLEDADRLAATGRFDEAVHLLLRRSVGQIAAARPDWLNPASTAREIAGIAALPAAARAAFAAISTRVERSRYALRPLAAEDWQAARAAYADFALVRIPA